MRLSRRPGREDGFTLVELLIAIAIGFVLLGSLGTALVVGLRTSEEAGIQVMEASWSQVVASWFITDVHGAESFSPGPEFACYALGSPPEDAIGLVGSFAWTAPEHFDAEPAVTTHADWWLLDEDGAEGDGSLLLMRTTCTSGGELGTPQLPVAEVVARHTEAAEISCEEEAAETSCEEGGLVYTLTWTASKTDVAPDRLDRVYETTAVRRLGS